MRQQQGLLNLASKEGAYYTGVYAMTRTEQDPTEVVAALHPQVMLLDSDITGCQLNYPRVLALPGDPLLRTGQSG